MNARLKIKNIKGQNKEVELGPINLISGDNGTGKSSILESLIVALDGEHPTAGKTLSAVCSMLSDDSGEIDLTLERGGERINIRRVFHRGQSNSQKIYVNGKELQQNVAKSMIDGFLGGTSSRKISPYKFALLSPKERLNVLAEMIPGDKAPDIEGIIKRSLYSGSEEVVGISRYVKGKPVEELEDEEMEEVAAAARKIDAEYIDLIENYFVPNTYGGAAEYAESLIALNREESTETQAEINRLTKALQTNQDELGDELFESGERESKEDLLRARAEIKEKIALANRELSRKEQAHEALRKLNKRLDDIQSKYQNIDSEIKKKNKEISDLKKTGASEATINTSAAYSNISMAENNIAISEKAKSRIETISKDIEIAREQEAKALQRYEEAVRTEKDSAEECSRLELTYSGIEDNIAALANKNICPLCGSKIDVAAVVESLSKAKQEISRSLEESRDKLSADKEKVETLSREKTSSGLLVRDYESALKRETALLMSDKDIAEAKQDISALKLLIKSADINSRYSKALSELNEMKAKRDAVKIIKTQIKDIDLSCDYTEGELDLLKQEAVDIEADIDEVTRTDALRRMIAAEQLAIEGLKQKRKYLKDIGKLLVDAKKQSYWFIDDVAKVVSDVMGKDGVISNTMFGISQDGVDIPDKVLSGGEKLMFVTAVLLGFSQLSDPDTAKIIEIEGSELDSSNIKALVNVIKRYPEVDMAIVTTHMDIEIDGVNNIKT
jgi:energy-coupling factor transporter ATP-binding protein EcfA2